MLQSLFLATTVLSFLFVPALGSLYDPHLFPSSGPFFEGWYFRFIDHVNRRSFATLFGKVLPKDELQARNPNYFGLLKKDGRSEKLLNFDDTPTTDAINLTVLDGQKISKNPDTTSPADFNWSVQHVGHVTVHPTSSNINVTIGSVRIEADIGKPLVWDASGRGPMGWLLNLPFIPLSWFVYSLGSPVKRYKWTDLKTGDIRTGVGYVHVEKNWGNSFPEGWIWTQSISADGTIAFAATYGPVGFGPVNVPGHLIGYRNYKKDISLDFRPDNSILHPSFDGCAGVANFTLYTLQWKVELVIQASPASFSDCLLGPMKNGFRPVAQESYTAHAHITVYKRGWSFSWNEVDKQFVDMTALEFGGTFSCEKKCVPKLDSD